MATKELRGAAMKILLLGCNGQVGWELQRSLLPLGELMACDFDSPESVRADFRDPRMVGALVDRVRPDVIVNAAAYTAVDKAESEPALSELVNARTVGAIADRARSIGALLVHYSTDYVFDGSGEGARDEMAPTGPLSVYGRTKLQGEELIRGSGCRHVILRTSWVYAACGHNFVKTMLKLAAERDSLNVINDQIGAPTGAEFLADATAQIVTRLALGRGEDGTYHCVAAGETSWFDYARFVIEWARAKGLPVKVAPEAIKPIPTSAYPTPARRPLNSRLSTEKLQRVFGLAAPHWRIGVERVLREIAGR
jgi:dTDP-4-dehydrorhamnose reductase